MFGLNDGEARWTSYSFTSSRRSPNRFARRARFRNSRQALLAKIFRFSRSANQVYGSVIPCPPEGAYRDRHDTWCGMRWTRRYRLTSDANADGKAVWSWHPDAGVKLADVCRRRRLSSPALRGERGISRKPLRRECRCFDEPVVTNSCAFYFAREAAGAASTRHSLRPSVSRGQSMQELGRSAPRE
jgi:hypothetical protein